MISAGRRHHPGAAAAQGGAAEVEPGPSRAFLPYLGAVHVAGVLALALALAGTGLAGPDTPTPCRR